MFRLPIICVLCHQYHTENSAICRHCRALLKPIGPACLFCAQPLPQDGVPSACGECLRKKPFLDRVITAHRFEEPLRTLLHAFKYREELYLANFLTQLMLQTAPSDIRKTQCLIPVPMHAKRLCERGFNHAAVLARALGKQLKLPCLLLQCKKVINTPPQASLTGSQRQKNLHNAFQISSIKYQSITLVDDLYTTGSTANELAHTLKKQGATNVQLWCCARTLR